MPLRLADALMKDTGIEDGTMLSTLWRESRRALVRCVTDMRLPVSGVAAINALVSGRMQRHRDQFAAGADGFLRLEIGEFAVLDVARPDPHHVGFADPEIEVERERQSRP